MFQKVGFIGTGNMGSAIATAIVKSEVPVQILLSNRTISKAQQLAEVLNIECVSVTDNQTIASQCDLIFLAVKPQMMQEMLSSVKSCLQQRTDQFVICTMAAGLSCARIQELAGGSYPIIRIMPNTPVGVGCGVVQVCSNKVDPSVLADFMKLIENAGIVDLIDEKLIDAASSVSGCGPAFAYLFLEALADGAVACGLPRDKAMKYAAGMLEGAAKLALTTEEHPGILKDAVCSPGGTTIQGVRTLEEKGFRGAVIDAVIAAYEKTCQLK